jgi:hypothetical protein
MIRYWARVQSEEPTSGLEPLACSLGVCSRAFLRLEEGQEPCRTPDSMRVTAVKKRAGQLGSFYP